MYGPSLPDTQAAPEATARELPLPEQNTLPDSHYAKSVQISWDNILYIHFYAFITLSNIYGTLSTQLWKLSTFLLL